jgi:GTP cyclohydrolase I
MRSACALRVVHEPDPALDLAGAATAAAQFLRALGVELDSDSMRGTRGGWLLPFVGVAHVGVNH